MTHEDLLQYSSKNEAIMKMMAKLAMEQATTYFALQARELAKDLPSEVTGKSALEIFASVIEQRNSEVWPRGNLCA